MKSKILTRIAVVVFSVCLIVGFAKNVEAGQLTQITQTSNPGDYVVYEYTGGAQTFTAPYPGIFTFDIYGAQGGNYSTRSGGKGGYIKADFELKAGETITITIGGQNGYNGGGSASAYGNGGGATTVVSSEGGLLAIAGGGGGAGRDANGGIGGASLVSTATEVQNGESGYAAGGGGATKGIAGAVTYHSHASSCYTNATGTCYGGHYEVFGGGGHGWIECYNCGRGFNGNAAYLTCDTHGAGAFYQAYPAYGTCPHCGSGNGDNTYELNQNGPYSHEYTYQRLSCGKTTSSIDAINGGNGGSSFISTNAQAGSVLNSAGSKSGNGQVKITIKEILFSLSLDNDNLSVIESDSFSITANYSGCKTWRWQRQSKGTKLSPAETDWEDIAERNCSTGEINFASGMENQYQIEAQITTDPLLSGLNKLKHTSAIGEEDYWYRLNITGITDSLKESKTALVTMKKIKPVSVVSSIVAGRPNGNVTGTTVEAGTTLSIINDIKTVVTYNNGMTKTIENGVYGTGSPLQTNDESLFFINNGTENESVQLRKTALNEVLNTKYTFNGSSVSGSFIVRVVDSTKPIVTRVQRDETGWKDGYTNRDYNISISFKDNAINAGFKSYFSKNDLSEGQKPSDVCINTYETGVAVYPVTENGTYYFYVMDPAGNISNRETILVDNFDTTAPVLTLSDITTKAGEPHYVDLDGKIWSKTVAAKVFVEDRSDVGGTAVGINPDDAYLFYIKNDYASMNNFTSSEHVFTVNGEYYVSVRDKLNNTSLPVKLTINSIDCYNPKVTFVDLRYETNGIFKIQSCEEKLPEEIKEVCMIISASDIGSGVKEYQLLKDGEVYRSWQKSNEFPNIYENGVYTVMVKDNLGNISGKAESTGESKKFVIDSLDDTYMVKFIDSTKEGDVLGVTERFYKIDAYVSASEMGVDKTTGIYYPGYDYTSCDTAIVTKNGAIVHRYFKLHEYKVTFYSQYGKELISQFIPYGNEVIFKGDVPKKEDIDNGSSICKYVFIGWQDSAGNMVDLSRVTCDMKLYPVFDIQEDFKEETWKEIENMEENISEGDGYSIFFKDPSEIDITMIGSDPIKLHQKYQLQNANIKDSQLQQNTGGTVIQGTEAQQLRQTIGNLFKNEKTRPVLQTMTVTGGVAAGGLALSGLMQLVTGAGLFQSIVFVYALVFKKQRYIQGAWMLDEEGINYVDKKGRKVNVEFDGKKYTFKRGKKILRAVNVNLLLDKLMTGRITYDQFNHNLTGSEVYTVFDKDVQIEVWNVKESNNKNTSKTKGFDLSKNISKMFDSAGQYAVRIKNGGKQIAFDLKYTAENL